MSSIISVRSTFLWERGRTRICIREARKLAGPADPNPDPQHWFSVREIQQMSVDETVFVVLVQVMYTRGVHTVNTCTFVQPCDIPYVNVKIVWFFRQGPKSLVPPTLYKGRSITTPRFCTIPRFCVKIIFFQGGFFLFLVRYSTLLSGARQIPLRRWP